MSGSRQIFQTESKLRWKTFQWSGRLIIFILALIIPVVWFAVTSHNDPSLPSLSTNNYTKSSEVNPKNLTARDLKKYKGGFSDYIRVKQKYMQVLAKEKHKLQTQNIRAGFYVDWDPQAFFSLQSHINSMNMVIPEWFFIDSSTGKVISHIAEDTAGYNLMKQNHVKILPMLTNVDTTSGKGDFNEEILHKVLSNPARENQLITDIATYLKRYGLQGVNVDFEELKETDIAPMQKFLKDLYARIHSSGYLITQDILPNDEDYNLKELAKYDDYVFLMAYDEHWGESVPGPISEQKWIEKETDKICKDIPANRLVICVAGFGYDWPEGDQAENLTYQQAISKARAWKSTVHFNDDSYNCSFTYTDNDSVDHKCYFIDAAGIFNTMRFADEYGAGGVALWRLGAEDERMWNFYGRELSDESLKKQPFDFSSFESVELKTEKPDYNFDGEVLDVVANPQKGIINIEVDSTDLLVSEENYNQLPTRYVINRFGEAVKKDSNGNVIERRVVLTFDDGPDPEYTPKILDILKKENVPAAFFVVGINAENNLPLLRRIYNQGYEIGNHSFTHTNMATVSTERAETEMEATRLLIEAVTGRSTILFRAPFNADAEPSKLVELKPIERGRQHHYYTVGESIDPEDWDVKSGVNADTIFNRVVRIYNSYKGDKGIILLHDAGGNRSATVEALPRIIDYFKSRGIKFATVGEILNKPKDVIMPPVHSGIVNMSHWSFVIFYWLEKILTAAFWTAIFLGLLRIALMAILATYQYRRSRKEKLIPFGGNTKPRVSIIVPAYNEQVNAVKTVANLLRQDYSNFDVIFVDDGSSDATYENVLAAFPGEKRLQVFKKANGGKASALNFGIQHCTNDFIICIDADTQLMPDAIFQAMKYFNDLKVGAVAGNIKVGNEKNVLTKWQSIEYITAQNFDRRAFDLVNCITVVPGALGAFRKEAVIKAGGFTSDTLAEDCDLTIRILRQGYVIRNCTEAIAVTESPETLSQFMKQRFRWSYGVMQSFWKNKKACFSKKQPALGWLAMPNIFLFQIILPMIAPLADVLFVVSLIWNHNDPDSMQKIISFYVLFLLIDLAASLIAFSFEKEKFYKLLWLIPQRFVYRQLMYVVIYRSIRKAMKGEIQGWGKLNRTGNVKPVVELINVNQKSDKVSV